jgi:hypothetical protein
MRESKIEKYLREQCERYGALCEKHVSPGRRGVPDRLISWPHWETHLAETKATGKGVKPNSPQDRDHKARKKIGHEVYVLNSIQAVDWYIKRCTAWRKIA